MNHVNGFLQNAFPLVQLKQEITKALNGTPLDKVQLVCLSVPTRWGRFIVVKGTFRTYKYLLRPITAFFNKIYLFKMSIHFFEIPGIIKQEKSTEKFEIKVCEVIITHMPTVAFQSSLIDRPWMLNFFNSSLKFNFATAQGGIVLPFFAKCLKQVT